MIVNRPQNRGFDTNGFTPARVVSMSKAPQDQPRQPKAAPNSSGGQYDKRLNPAPSSILHGDSPAAAAEQLEARRALLRERGYAPAGSAISETTPHTTHHIAVWWDAHFKRAEVAPGKEFALMPDDYTPGQKTGRALSGKRRTHRMKYQGAGVTVRMPSATALKRFSKENGDHTFDVPIELEHDGGTVTGFVRVTKSGRGSWDVQALNIPAPAGPKAAEAVCAVLEARKPSTALAEVDSLLEHRRRRWASHGVELKEPHAPSQMISSMGYNQASRQLTMKLGSRVYSYEAPKEVFDAIQNSSSPGLKYNQLVRKKRQRHEVSQCKKCKRWTPETIKHRCPPAAGPNTERGVGAIGYAQRVQTMALNFSKKPEPPAAVHV
ncbi:hypothetical protein [Lysinibacter cavernae]|uniref:hypothetical protein n=1 Tax=Lysinibacter cavernae TaxID=1640652 RepID=UPI00360B28F6